MNKEAETRTRKKEKRGTTRIKRTIENREWRVKNVTEKTENKSQWGQRELEKPTGAGEKEPPKNECRMKNLQREEKNLT